jgi:protein-tyrosine phosphatase
MIDIHCHILPGLDDGAKNMDEALEMCRVAQADGIQTIVATPHCRNGTYHNHEGTILPVLDQLQEAVLKAGLSLRLLPGADLHIHPELIVFLKQNSRLLLGGRYFLLELPAQSIPPFTRDFIFKALLTGFVPIITHPERNTMIQNQDQVIEEWVNAGALIQITAMSLTGDFGQQVRDCALKMVRSGLVHVIATDAHSAKRRPPVLSQGREILKTLVGEDQARTMISENPTRILKGESVEVLVPKTTPNPHPSIFKQFLKRYFKKP